MKVHRLIAATLVLLFLQGAALSQFKSQTQEKPRVSESMIRPGSSDLFLGIFDPANFSMRHSYSFSYLMMSGRNIGVGMYTSSMNYRVSDPLDLRLDVSLMHSPIGSFGKDLQNSSNKIFINRAEVNYRPFENMLINLQYRQVPYSFYWGNYSPYYYDPFYRGYESSR